MADGRKTRVRLSKVDDSTGKSPASLELVLEDNPQGADADALLRYWKDASCLDPRYASGQIFTPQVLGSLLAHAFYTPGIVEVMQALITPDAEDANCNVPWQVHLSPEYHGLTYGELVPALTQDWATPLLPFGIYRSFETEGNGNKGYVWTNPPEDTELLRTDMLYVLADQRFGKLAYSQGLLPMSGKERLLPPSSAQSTMLPGKGGFRPQH